MLSHCSRLTVVTSSPSLRHQRRGRQGTWVSRGGSGRRAGSLPLTSFLPWSSLPWLSHRRVLDVGAHSKPKPAAGGSGSAAGTEAPATTCALRPWCAGGLLISIYGLHHSHTHTHRPLLLRKIPELLTVQSGAVQGSPVPGTRKSAGLLPPTRKHTRDRGPTPAPVLGTSPDASDGSRTQTTKEHSGAWSQLPKLQGRHCHLQTLHKPSWHGSVGEHPSMNQEVPDSVPGQGRCPGC